MSRSHDNCRHWRGIPFVAEQPIGEFPAEVTTIEERQPIGDGVWLSTTVRVHPNPAAPKVVLIHSLALDRFVWEAVAQRLSAECTVLTYDCRGHGDSSKSTGPYSVEQFADDLATLFAALGWEQAAVAGCSMGGGVALAFAGRHPRLMRALTLVDTTAWYGPDAPARWEERALKAEREGIASLVEFQRKRWFTEGFLDTHEAVVARCVRTFLANDIGAYAATCRMLGAMDLRPLLGTIRVPTAILVGEEDYATPPAMAGALHVGIANSTLTVVPKGRHLLPLEHPDPVAQAITSLLRALDNERSH
ncbi:alpha/beta fold hydrolase [bacterium]|nr:MAG: alpha/beta fold hydrolase [bacterium]